MVLMDIVPTAVVAITSTEVKKGFLFNTLIDVTAVDYPDKENGSV